ncbi:hypothetical protein Dimus_038453 [Dionaea muscipula]
MARVSYSSAVGSLMYAMVCTRPDLAVAVSVVSRFMANLEKVHWAAMKWILRYLRDTYTSCLIRPNAVAGTDALIPYSGIVFINMKLDGFKYTASHKKRYTTCSINWVRDPIGAPMWADPICYIGLG